MNQLSLAGLGRLAALLFLGMPLTGALADERGEYLILPGGIFQSALRYEDARNGVRVASFELM